MITWQQHITAKIAPSTQLSLVYDPHGLVRSASVQTILAESGYQVYFYIDDVSFRIEYEAQFRPQLRDNRLLYILVILPYTQSTARHLPYVMLHQHAEVEITLADLFPLLHISPLTELSNDDVSALWASVQTIRRPLDIIATQHFLLRTLYAIDITQINSREDALTTLCRLHYQQQQLTPSLMTMMSHHPVFQLTFGAALPQMLSSTPRFLQYLRGLWRYAAQQYIPEIPKPDNTYRVDFNQPTLNVHLITFFHLQLIETLVIHTPIQSDWPEWLTSGLRYDATHAMRDHLDKLRANLINTVPQSTDVHTAWLKYAQQYAIYTAKRAEVQDVEYEPWQLDVDTRFREWLIRNYKMLHSLAPNNPAMVHHIAQQMQRVHQQHTARKLALIVVDGMAIHQWLVIQEMLLTQLPHLTITNSSVFAWIPTITNVSRQAIFAGKTPKNFADSILTTNAEGRLWQKFWDPFLPKHKIGYIRALGTGTVSTDLATYLTNPQMQILGLVVDSIDELVHGAILGMHGLQQQVHTWGAHGYLKELIETLAQANYDIWLTSDHGNCAAIGAGTLSEGVLVGQRGARARMYQNDSLRQSAQTALPTATLAWPAVELPPNFLPVLPLGYDAFIKKDQRIISHGGTSIEEVIVPFIRISQGSP